MSPAQKQRMNSYLVLIYRTAVVLILTGVYNAGAGIVKRIDDVYLKQTEHEHRIRSVETNEHQLRFDLNENMKRDEDEHTKLFDLLTKMYVKRETQNQQ